jgi:hypothetical protein
MIAITCPCGKRLQISEKYAGQQGLCPICRRALDIPRYGSGDGDESTAPSRAPTVQEIPVSREEQSETPVDLTIPEVPPPGEPWRPPEGRKDPGGLSPTVEEQSKPPGPWQPPEGMTDHCGRSSPLLADFFVPPPPEIGEILSAHSSLRIGVKPLSKAARTAWILGLVCGGPLLGLEIGIQTKNEVLMLFLGILAGGIVAIIAFYGTRFSHRCTYVGREGIARYLCIGNRGQFDTRVLRFHDAAELRVTKTLRYRNNLVQGIDYSFTWTDASGRPVYRIVGTHKSVSGTPNSKDAYHFAAAAEVAWSKYMLRQRIPQMMSGETIFFSLGRGDWVRLGHQQLVVCLEGEMSHCDLKVIVEVRIEQGWIELHRKDWDSCSSSEIFKIPFGDLGNAQLFLFLMDRLGIRVNWTTKKDPESR